jgi:hypothetical protein
MITHASMTIITISASNKPTINASAHVPLLDGHYSSTSMADACKHTIDINNEYK